LWGVGVADDDAGVVGDAAGSHCARARARADGGECPCTLRRCVVSEWCVRAFAVRFELSCACCNKQPMWLLVMHSARAVSV
jgi:hypothetical protein